MSREQSFTSQIGDKIRRLRKAKDLSLTALAERAGISKSYLSHIETGKVENVSLNILRKIASALRIDLFELIGNIHKPREKDSDDFQFPFNKEELERILAQSSIDENMVDEKTRRTLVTLGTILTDPELPVRHIGEMEEKLSSYARWLSDRMKRRSQDENQSREVD